MTGAEKIMLGNQVQSGSGNVDTSVVMAKAAATFLKNTRTCMERVVAMPNRLRTRTSAMSTFGAFSNLAI